MSATNNNFLRAVKAREFCAEAPEGADVSRYSFPTTGNRPIEDLRVRLTVPGSDTPWIGVFECTLGRHVDVIPWPQAEAVVVVASNAVYIVNPRVPEEFSGVAAPIEITGVTFDESAQHMFVADSLRIYAFSSDRTFQWMSEPFEGYGAHFCGCGRRVLAVEINSAESDADIEDARRSLIRFRTEDRAILRSRFRLVNRYWTRNAAA